MCFIFSNKDAKHLNEAWDTLETMIHESTKKMSNMPIDPKSPFPKYFLCQINFENISHFPLIDLTNQCTWYDEHLLQLWEEWDENNEEGCGKITF